MASVSAGKWHEGDRCLAPDPRDGTLREASIQRLTTTHNNDAMARVVFTDRDKDEEEEEALPLSKLMRPVLNYSNEEKPVFSNSVIDSRLCVPLELSDVDGDRVPYTINRYLRDYQREGIRFIYNNYRSSRGCILGDDMGLGKTIQVIGFLSAVLHKTGTWQDVKNNRPQFLQSQMPYQQSKPNKVFLIVAPLSVLYNWKDELDTWGNFQCVVVHGLRKEEELDRIKKGRTEIALTTYETLRLCLDQFNNIGWSAVVVDEAHKIKNPNSQVTQAMKDLKCEIRIGLTGTILQNNLDELWCVMDWAIPGCLGSLTQFKNKFSDPVEQGQRHNATKRALATGRKMVRALVSKISHWFLRRTKALIKEQLPRKDDRMVYCSLTDFQQSVYQTVLDTEDVKLLLRSSEKCDCQSGRTRHGCCYKTNSDGVKMKELYFSYLAILRKVANHVALLKSTAGTSKKQNMYVAAICAKVFQKFPDFVQRCKDEAFEALSDPMYSGKMKVLQKLLKYYLQKRDNKILLFSLSTKLLDVLENYCMAEGLDYRRLDGNTKAKERVKIVREFNSSPHITLCLVSTMAGGLGLNFVGANVVVLFDPTWNPANDLQAVDRVYRIGQCRDVTILRLISLGTVEEVIYLRQVYKQQLQSSVVGNESARRYFEAVRGSGVHKGELFGIKNLFRLQTEGTCLTRKILEREGQLEAGVMTTSNQTGTEEEETKRASVSRDVPPRDGPEMKDEAAMENRYASKDSRGVLDFSSASEEDEDKQGLKMKTSNTSAASGIRSKNAATCSVQLSLLRHGFSKLLERVKGKPELGEGDSSSCVDESPVEEDGYQKREDSSSNICQRFNSGNSAMCQRKLGKATYDRSSSSDGEYGENKDRGRKEKDSLMKQNNDSVKKRPDLKGWTNKSITVDEESDESSSPDTNKPNKVKNRVQKVDHLEHYSDESEDLDIEEVSRNALESHVEGRDGERLRLNRNRKRPCASFRHKARSTYSEDIQTFTSSEDEHTPVKKERPTRSHFTSPVETPKDRPTSERANRAGKQAGMSKFTNLFGKRISLASKDRGGTIDSVLGGVQEVMHVHSNQRVVGGSKAEELISKAAIRDVFERKLYSQLPANRILDSMESLSASPQETQPCSTPVRLEKPSADHPVTFTNKSVHHTRLTTFIIGETPQSVRRALVRPIKRLIPHGSLDIILNMRTTCHPSLMDPENVQQLEEMAKNLKFSSVHQFAMEILRGNSTQRLTWLRQHYTSLDQPDLANIVTNNFPQPDSIQTSSSLISTKTAATKCQADTKAPQKDIRKASKKAKHNRNNPDPEPKPVTQHSFVSSPQKNPITLQNGVQEPRKKLKISHENALEPLSDVPGLESEKQEETVCKEHTRTKKVSVSHSGPLRGGGGLGLDQAGCSGLGSWEATPLLNRRDRGIPSSPDPIHGRFTKLCKPTAQQKEQEQKSSRTSKTPQGQRENPPPQSPPEKTSTSSPRSFLSDLIGDTSILDDLLKPKSRGAQVRGTPKTPPALSSATVSTRFSKPSPSTISFNTDSGSADSSDTLTSPNSKTPSMQQAHSKSSHKDFWDILNEGNEDTINRLTDPAEVHRVCINTKSTARRRSREEEHRSLWKMNERFLWKK